MDLNGLLLNIETKTLQWNVHTDCLPNSILPHFIRVSSWNELVKLICDLGTGSLSEVVAEAIISKSIWLIYVSEFNSEFEEVNNQNEMILMNSFDRNENIDTFSCYMELLDKQFW